MKIFSPKLLFLAILSLLFPAISLAQVVINEVQTSPIGERFIELYNTSDSSIDLTGWYMQRRTTTGGSFGSLVSNPNFENKTIGAYGYFVISRNPLSSSNIVLSTLTLTESNIIQIKNSNGDIVDKVGWGSVSDCGSPCPSNPPDGQSIQRIISEWITALPTPGVANSNSGLINRTGEVLSADTESSPSSSQSATSGSVAPMYFTPGTQLEVSAGGDRLTSPGSPISFQAFIKKNSVSNSAVSFSWSFGDGNVGEGALVSHVYKYPGEHAVVLNARAGNIFAVSRLKVKVVEPKLSLSEEDNYIEIFNNSNSEINLFSWKIVKGGRGFIFQPDTIILPQSTMKIDNSLLAIKGEPEQNITLKNFLGQEIINIARKPDENNLKEITMQVDEIQKQANSLINKAIAANLVMEKSAPVPNPSQTKIDGAVSSLIDLSGLTENSSVSTTTERIIYEAPRQKGLLSILTNFIKRVFSK